MTTGG